MHEQSIAKKIIEEATKHGSVKAITVEVGDLGHLPANEMKEALQGLVNWEINVEQKKATVKCSCGYKGTPVIHEKAHAHVLYSCPDCKKVPEEIIDGADIILKDVTIE